MNVLPYFSKETIWDVVKDLEIVKVDVITKSLWEGGRKPEQVKRGADGIKSWGDVKKAMSWGV
jgi:hypothetical protein